MPPPPPPPPPPPVPPRSSDFNWGCGDHRHPPLCRLNATRLPMPRPSWASNGDGLTAQSVTVDGAAAEWRMAALTDRDPARRGPHIVEIVTRIDPGATPS